MARKKPNRSKTLRKCDVCNTPYLAVIYELKRGKGRLCSLSCAASQSSKNREDFGENNNNWKGDKVKNPKRRVYSQRNREKVTAHRMLNRALEKGLLSKGACEICGEDKVHGHHEDYSKPLSVTWLCPKHHMRLHTKKTSVAAP